MVEIAKFPQEVLDMLSVYLLPVEKQSWRPYCKSKPTSEARYRDMCWVQGATDIYATVYSDPLLMLFMTGDRLLHHKIFKLRHMELGITRPRTTVLFPKFENLTKLAIALDMLPLVDKAQKQLPSSLTSLDITDPVPGHKSIIYDITKCVFPESLTHFGLNLSHNGMYYANLTTNIPHQEVFLKNLPKTLLSLALPAAGCDSTMSEIFPNLVALKIFGANTCDDLFWEKFPQSVEIFEGMMQFFDGDHLEHLPKILTEFSMQFVNFTITDADVGVLSRQLVKLDVRKAGGLTTQCVDLLPKTLTKLGIKFVLESTTFLDKLPRGLTYLYMNCLGNLRFDDLNGLPQGLTYLHVILKANLENVVFPPKLITLNLFHNGSIDRSFWQTIPKSITSLSSSYQFSKNDFGKREYYDEEICRYRDINFCKIGLPPGLRYLSVPDTAPAAFRGMCREIFPIINFV
jgi:hypothetical protein